MQIPVEKDEAQFVKYILGCMGAFRPREMSCFGYKKADVPVMERGVLVLSQNPIANNQLVEFMQMAIEMKQEADASKDDIDSSIRIMEKVKNSLEE